MSRLGLNALQECRPLQILSREARCCCHGLLVAVVAKQRTILLRCGSFVTATEAAVSRVTPDRRIMSRLCHYYESFNCLHFPPYDTHNRVACFVQ